MFPSFDLVVMTFSKKNTGQRYLYCSIAYNATMSILIAGIMSIFEFHLVNLLVVFRVFHLQLHFAAFSKSRGLPLFLDKHDLPNVIMALRD